VARTASILVAVCVGVMVLLPASIALLVHPPSLIRPDDMWISVWDHSARVVRRLSLQDYLVGVVAAEMPASFELEALKAQAVAARTYTLRRLANDAVRMANEHPGGAQICTDPSHCQAWNSREQLVGKWGAGAYLANVRRIIAAVESTYGLVMTYNGQLIDAVYHSCCGGMTEDAAEVWGRRIPYLVPVACGCGRRGVELGEARAVDNAYLLAALGIGARGVPALASGVRVAARTGTDRASIVSVYGVPVSAAQLRRTLSLKSTRIAISSEGGKTIFRTTGYGHGVGMCQWGAASMAERGETFDAILRHYYTGVRIQQITSGENKP
jgi:stage II sporulation protein D